MLEIDETQALEEEEQAFAEELSAGITSFWEDRQPLVVTVNPIDDVYSDDIFLLSDGDSPRLPAPESVESAIGTAIDHSAGRQTWRRRLADAESLDDAARIKIGTALLTGDGAPRSIEAGARILLPVAMNRPGRGSRDSCEGVPVGRSEQRGVQDGPGCLGFG